MKVPSMKSDVDCIGNDHNVVSFNLIVIINANVIMINIFYTNYFLDLRSYSIKFLVLINLPASSFQDFS